jgi:hypothetical protein
MVKIPLLGGHGDMVELVIMLVLYMTPVYKLSLVGELEVIKTM